MRHILFLLALLSGVKVYSQTTIGHESQPKDKSERMPIAVKKHKILLIPFEPKMYMSEIDHKINAETEWNQKQIRAAFREGVDDQLYKALKQHFEVLSLLDDTTKYKKDLNKIYGNITYKYEKIPDQEHYTPPKEKENDKSGIKNGQIVTESNTTARFMNTKIINAALVPELFAKYKTDVFLFINQIDITAAVPASTNDFSTSGERKITLHYTVYTVDAKEINSGIATVHFPPDVNNPGKISSAYFSKIASEINRRIEKVLIPAATPTNTKSHKK